MRCLCQIVPPHVLDRLRRDESLSAEAREAMANTLRLDEAIRRIREEATELSRVALSIAPPVAVAPSPQLTVFNCHHSQVLPGAHVNNPGGSSDVTARTAFNETTQVAAFYQQLFHRNSVDGAGMTLISSIHYGRAYNNAFWNGSQMTYGDGDGQIFVDFTRGEDVIGHELTHGVTQHSLQLTYVDQPGGLNESISDCFGSMFKQWRKGQTSASADWLIGSDIMGPAATAKGYTCLRDMAAPDAQHCLSPQPTHFSQFQNGMDPHVSSGIPNKAFHDACVAAGGHSWDKVGPAWYGAVTGSGSQPNMTMKAFADRTRAVAAQLFAGDAALAQAVDAAWQGVGL